MGLVQKFYGGLTSTPRQGCSSLYDCSGAVREKLERCKGKALLIVNTASKCGFARQYDDLEALHQQYAPQGLVVLGFPSNDFLQQEPGSDDEIQAVCRLNHGVTFDIMPKGAVRGAGKQPLFALLTEQGPADLRGEVKWNFEKFLVDKDGFLVGRWRSYVSPRSRSVTQAIERVLK